MKLTKRQIIIPLLLVLVVGLFTLSAGVAEKQLRIGMWSAPSSFSPINNPSGYGDAAVHLIYDALVDHSDTFEYVPGLARSWSVEEGSTSFLFELYRCARCTRQASKPCDDARLYGRRERSPRDLVVNVQVLNAAFKALAPIRKALAGQPFGVQKVDERTVAIRTRVSHGGRCLYDPGRSKVHIVPVHVLGSVPPAELHRHESNLHPTRLRQRTFCLSNTVLDQYVEFEKHEAYHKGTTKIDRVFSGDSAGATMTAALEQGVIDITAGGAIGEVTITDWSGPGLAHVESSSFHADGVSSLADQSRRARI